MDSNGISETFETFVIKNIAPIMEGTAASSAGLNEYQSKSSFNDFEYWNRSISNIDDVNKERSNRQGDFDDDSDEDIYAGDNAQIFQIVEYKEGKPVNR